MVDAESTGIGVPGIKNHAYFKTVGWPGEYQRRSNVPIISQLKTACRRQWFDECTGASESESIYTSQEGFGFQKELRKTWENAIQAMR